MTWVALIKLRVVLGVALSSLSDPRCKWFEDFQIMFADSIHIDSGLGMVGALITISTLAFDFFAQQVTVVHYRSTALSNGTHPGIIIRSEEYSQFDNNGISVSECHELLEKRLEYPADQI